MKENEASYRVRVDGVLDTDAKVLFGKRQVEVRVTVKNLTKRTWRNVNACTCFAFTHAPAFDDKNMTRSFVRIDDHWRTLADLFHERSPGGNALTFLGVEGGPRVQDFVGRQANPTDSSH